MISPISPSCPVAESPEHDHLALIVSEPIEKAEEPVEPDHGQSLVLDVDPRPDELLSDQVQRFLHAHHAPPYLIDASGTARW